MLRKREISLRFIIIFNFQLSLFNLIPCYKAFTSFSKNCPSTQKTVPSAVFTSLGSSAVPSLAHRCNRPYRNPYSAFVSAAGFPNTATHFFILFFQLVKCSKQPQHPNFDVQRHKTKLVKNSFCFMLFTCHRFCTALLCLAVRGRQLHTSADSQKVHAKCSVFFLRGTSTFYYLTPVSFILYVLTSSGKSH